MLAVSTPDASSASAVGLGFEARMGSSVDGAGPPLVKPASTMWYDLSGFGVQNIVLPANETKAAEISFEEMSKERVNQMALLRQDLTENAAKRAELGQEVAQVCLEL